MKILSIVVLFFVALILGRAEDNNSLSDETLLKIKFDQKIGNQVSTDLVFTNETGNAIPLRSCLGSRPAILVLGYYGCPMLCTLVLNGVTDCMRNLKWSTGQQFDVIFVSIDPAESFQLAAAKKKAYAHIYGRDASAAGWHFLTGNEKSIRALASQIGFHYAYDPQIKQFAHPSGFVVLTPGGKVSHYFFGVTYSASQLDAALRDAQSDKLGSPVQELFLLCFHYSPFPGKYGHLVITIVRIAGVVMVLSLAALVWTQRGRQKTRRPE